MDRVSSYTLCHQEAGSQLIVIARGAHGNRNGLDLAIIRRAVGKLNFERLLNGDGIVQYFDVTVLYSANLRRPYRRVCATQQGFSLRLIRIGGSTFELFFRPSHLGAVIAPILPLLGGRAGSTAGEPAAAVVAGLGNL